MRYLDETMDVIMRGMGIIGTVIGDPPNPEKSAPKSDHPATFEQSLRDNEQQKEEKR